MSAEPKMSPMDRRLEHLKAIRKERGHSVLVYFTGDRQGAGAQIGNDALPVIASHLRALEPDSLDLVLYSLGGNLMASLAIMRCIRECAKNYHVLVPFKAQSAATLIAAGADSIVMGPLGQLGPVDPTITTPFCPPAPGAPGQFIGVSVEDVKSYLRLAKHELGDESWEESGSAAFQRLAEEVHPLALGAVERAREQNARLLKDALLSHLTEDEAGKLDPLIKELTERLPSHSYPISRQEARKMGLDVSDASAPVESAMWSLYEEFAQAMQLNEPFYPGAHAPRQKDASATKKLEIAAVQSEKACHIFEQELRLTWEKVEVTVPGAGRQKRGVLQCETIATRWKRVK